MKKYTLNTNKRYIKDCLSVNPYIFTYKKIEDKSLIINAKFGKNALFNHNNNNDLKKDWNKLWGISLRLWPSNKDYISVGWSPSEDNKDFIELIPYANISSEEHLFYTGSIALVKPEEKFLYEIYPISKQKWVVHIITKYSNSYKQFEFNINPLIFRRTRFYFGGNKKSPQKMDIYFDSYLK